MCLSHVNWLDVCYIVAHLSAVSLVQLHDLEFLLQQVVVVMSKRTPCTEEIQTSSLVKIGDQFSGKLSLVSDFQLFYPSTKRRE